MEFYTKCGNFNIDMVFSCAFLRELFKDCKITRVEQLDDNMDKNMAFAIEGGRYVCDIKDKRLNFHGECNCAFGMLWMEYGEKFLVNNKIKDVEHGEQLFYERLVSKINNGTRYGFKTVRGKGFYSVILKMIPTWDEILHDQKIEDIQYERAVLLAGGFIKNAVRQVFEDVEMRSVEDEIWKRAKDESDGGVYVLEERIPWRYQLKKDPESDVKIIVSKSNRGGYNVVSTDVSVTSVEDSEYLSYLHPSKFMGVADNLKNAIKAAKYSIALNSLM